MGSAVSGVANSMRSLGTSSSMFLQSLASGVYLAQRLANAVGEIMNLADTSRSQVARLGLYNTSEYSTEALYGQVFRTSMGTRSGLTETADLTNKILVSGVYSGEDAVQAAIGTADIINRALVAGGGTNEENQRAIRQLTQGLASGVLQGDELRSIREQAPYFAQVLAEGLSKIDKQFEGIGIGDLKKLGSEGELTADRVVKAMWAMQDEVNEDFKATPKTFGQAMTSLSNMWQYFLWMLSGTDRPLGRINDKLWQLVDYLQSPQGLELLDSVAQGIDLLSRGVTSIMDLFGRFVVFLQNNSDIAQASFIALGAVAVASGVKAAAAWIAAVWPILLIAGLVGLISYKFIEAGYTAEQVVGAIAGGVLWVAAVIWDVIVAIAGFLMWSVGLIAIAVVGVGAGVILVIQGIVQAIMWAVMAIITVFRAIGAVIESVFTIGKAAVQGFVIAVVGLFYGMAQVVLGILSAIASAIDAVFGSGLAGAVNGWSASLEGKFYAFVQENDPTKTLGELGDIWSEFGDKTANMFTDSEYNLFGEMGNVVNGAGDLISGAWDLLNQGDSALYDMFASPSEWYNTGHEWGAGVVEGITAGLPGSSAMDQFNADEVTINGGSLDSVNGGSLDSIKDDVHISDEDIQLLKDMVTRDVLLQLQAITPVANIKFGDVRETADVNKIVEVIEQMVEEQMATALIS